MKIQRKGLWNTPTGGGGSARDFFPLAPLLAVGALWWGAAAYLITAWMAALTVVGVASGYGLYRWLCGPGMRANLAAVALAFVFAVAWWRGADFRPLPMYGFFGMLALLWLPLKFAGRIHYTTRDDSEETQPGLDWTSARTMMGDSLGVEDIVPRVRQSGESIDKVWTTVGSTFRPRLSSRLSVEKRRSRALQIMAAGATLIVLAFVTYDGSGATILKMYFSGQNIVWLLVAAGVTLVQVGWEFRAVHAESEATGVTDVEVRAVSPPRSAGRSEPSID